MSNESDKKGKGTLLLSEKIHNELKKEAILAGKKLHREFGDDIIMMGLAQYRRAKKIQKIVNK